MVRDARRVTPDELTPEEGAELARLVAGYHESSRRLDALEEARAALQVKWAELSAELEGLRAAEASLKEVVGGRMGEEVTLVVVGG